MDDLRDLTDMSVTKYPFPVPDAVAGDHAGAHMIS